jgi:sugar (pentulose or hexulose) kinase
MEVFLGIDYGTGGAKGCIANLEGKVLGYYFEEYPIITSKPGWSEHNPHLYWEIACRIIQNSINQAKINSADIKCIAVSCALPCMVMIDREGNPINNAYNLMDRRATREVQWVKDNIGEKAVFDITANRLDDHHDGVNILWEKSNRPDDFRQIYKILTISSYINFKLTGSFSEVHQNAFFSGLYHATEKRYDEGLMEKFGINPGIFPDLHFAKDIIGTVTREAAENTGLHAGTPVCGGQADFTASCIASGVIDVGDVQSNLGTCGNFGVVHKDTNFMYEMITWGFTVGEEDTYITAATTTTGGMSLRFIRDNFSQLEVAAENAFGINSYALLDIQAEKVPAGSNGLIVLPFLTGERTPIWDSYARAVVFGLSLDHTKSHFIRATMEGVAYAMYDSLVYYKKRDIKINYPLVMHEGGAKSNVWRHIITDVFNVETVLTKSRTGAPFGDAVLAAYASGYLKDFSVCKQWAEYVERMEPDKEKNKIYMEYFEVYKKIYESVKNNFRDLAALRDKYHGV